MDNKAATDNLARPERLDQLVLLVYLVCLDHLATTERMDRLAQLVLQAHPAVIMEYPDRLVSRATMGPRACLDHQDCPVHRVLLDHQARLDHLVFQDR